MFRDRQPNKRQLIRYILLYLQVGLILYTVFIFGPVRLTKYFTNYTLLIQTFSIWLSIKAANDHNFSKDLAAQAMHHFVYTISLIFNFAVVSIYWTLVHEESMKEFKGQPTKIVQQYIVHIQPAICCLINSYMTDCVMSRHLLKPSCIIYFLYMGLNFVQTRMTGVPVYAFMPWTTYETPLLMTVLLVAFSIVFIAFCIIDETLKLKKVK